MIQWKVFSTFSSVRSSNYWYDNIIYNNSTLVNISDVKAGMGACCQSQRGIEMHQNYDVFLLLHQVTKGNIGDFYTLLSVRFLSEV